jgi:MFS family permease
MHWGDWPAIFWVNFPFIIASLLLGMWVFPPDQRDDSQRQTHETVRETLRKLDIPGIGLFAAAVVFSLLFLLSVTTGVEWWAGISAALAICGFVVREVRSPRPFIDLKMFRDNAALSWVLLQFVTVNIVFYSIFFGMPTYLQEVLHYNAQDTGLLMLCIAGFGVVLAPVTGRWTDRSGSRPPLLLAGLCMTIGSGLCLTLGDSTPIWWLAVVLSILGVCNGFNNVGLQTALFRVTPPDIISTASGLFQTSRFLGAILSTVLLGILFGNHMSTVRLHQLGVVLAAIGALVIWMSWRLPRHS